MTNKLKWSEFATGGKATVEQILGSEGNKPKKAEQWDLWSVIQVGQVSSK